MGNPYGWHRWFAWHPVKVRTSPLSSNTEWTWLRWVSRRKVAQFNSDWWEYRW